MNVEGSLFAEAMEHMRRLNDNAFEEEEVGHEVANEMLVAQDQLKKATSTTMLESYTQGQAVDQSKAVILDEEDKENVDQGETTETVQDTTVKAVPLDENGLPITADNLNGQTNADEVSVALTEEELAQKKLEEENKNIEEGFDKYQELDANAESQKI